MNRPVLSVAFSLLTTSVVAQSLQVVGYSGHLGEWELSAVVTEAASGKGGEFSGVLMMKHIGLCSRDGPEEKSGQIRLHMPASKSRLDATLVIAGIECDFVGRYSEPSYRGMMNCPDRPASPLQLWLK